MMRRYVWVNPAGRVCSFWFLSREDAENAWQRTHDRLAAELHSRQAHGLGVKQISAQLFRHQNLIVKVAKITLHDLE